MQCRTTNALKTKGIRNSRVYATCATWLVSSWCVLKLSSGKPSSSGPHEKNNKKKRFVFDKTSQQLCPKMSLHSICMKKKKNGTILRQNCELYSEPIKHGREIGRKHSPSSTSIDSPSSTAMIEVLLSYSHVAQTNSWGNIQLSRQ